MKKAILLIAALLALGSMAFADVGIGCWGRTYFVLAAGASGPGGAIPEGTIAQGWGPNWYGSTRMGVSFNFSSKFLAFTVTTYYGGAFDSENSGWGLNQDAANTSNGGNNLYIANMYGVVKAIPDLLTINVGYMGGDGFDTYRKSQANPNSDFNDCNARLTGWGLWVTLAPKDLNFHVTVNMMTPSPDGSNHGYLGYSSWQPSFQFNAANSLHNINVLADYTVPDIIKITAGFLNDYSAGKTTIVYDGTNLSAYHAFARVELLAIQGIQLWVDASLRGFETGTYSLENNLGFAYTGIANLGLYLAANITSPLSPAGDVTIKASVEGTYDLKPITIGLYGVVNMNTAAGNHPMMVFRPYVSFDDLAMQIGFDYGINPLGGDINYWAVPVTFTFSF